MPLIFPLSLPIAISVSLMATKRPPPHGSFTRPDENQILRAYLLILRVLANRITNAWRIECRLPFNGEKHSLAATIEIS
jgi:hypothetical protein